MPVARYREFVEKLESYKGHPEDKRRKTRRKDLLLLKEYEEKEFVPRDLTTTSQLVRLAAQAAKKVFAAQGVDIPVISLPGSVTGFVRKGWNVTGCLAAANPQVLDENAEVRTKTEIRDITHLHHALDACVLALTAHFLPNNGRLWEMLLKRNLTAAEQHELKALGIFETNAVGRFGISDLRNAYKDQIRMRLSERRVVQHIPARMSGLRAEQNVWRVLEEKEDGEVTICQYRRGPDGKRTEVVATEKAIRLLGLKPPGGAGKLKRLKGVLIIPDNYGVALEPAPTIIPYHKVPTRLAQLREANGGKPVQVLRNGHLIQVPNGRYSGVWRIFSVKNKATGMALDIGRPDVVRLKDKTEGHKTNVLLSTLIRNGLKVLKAPLTGVSSCPTTSSV